MSIATRNAIGNAIRHGDLQIQPITPVPIEGRAEIPRESIGLVLRRGTAAGNAHVIVDDGARLYDPGDVEGTTLLVVEHDAVSLTHAEHCPVTLVAGQYRVGVARQGEDGAWDAVDD